MTLIIIEKFRSLLKKYLLLGLLCFIFSAHADYIKPTILLAKTNGYLKAKKYFEKRKRPLHHFLDIGVGAILIESFYPFKTTSHPFFAYINYRKEKWGQTKLPIIFSFQYESLLIKNLIAGYMPLQA